MTRVQALVLPIIRSLRCDEAFELERQPPVDSLISEKQMECNGLGWPDSQHIKSKFQKKCHVRYIICSEKTAE